MATFKEIFRVILNLICHIFIGIVVYYVWSIMLHVHHNHWAHAAMMILAIPFCFAEGLLVFDSFNYTKMCSERVNKVLHIVWFLSGGILAVIGGFFGFINYRKERIWKAHGIMGMIAVAIIAVSFVFGCILLCGRAGERKNFSKIHWIAGLIGYIIGMVAFMIEYHATEAIILIIGITIITLIAPIELLLVKGDSELKE